MPYQSLLSYFYYWHSMNAFGYQQVWLESDVHFFQNVAERGLEPFGHAAARNVAT